MFLKKSGDISKKVGAPFHPVMDCWGSPGHTLRTPALKYEFPRQLQGWRYFNMWLFGIDKWLQVSMSLTCPLLRLVKFLDWSTGAEPRDELRLKAAMKKDRFARLLCCGTVRRQNTEHPVNLKTVWKHHRGALAPKPTVGQRDKETEHGVRGGRRVKRVEWGFSKQEGGWFIRTGWGEKQREEDTEEGRRVLFLSSIEGSFQFTSLVWW